MSKSKSKRSPKKRSPPRIPIYGSIHNEGFCTAIGGLIINWSNNESVFRAMLQAFVAGDHKMAAIIWQSNFSTDVRLRLLWRLCRERIDDENLLGDIKDAIDKFRGCSKVRNFYCHATYEYDNEGHIITASSATTPDDGVPLKIDSREMTRGRLNEITSTTKKLAALNREIWLIVERLHAELELPPVKMHPLLRASLDNQ